VGKERERKVAEGNGKKEKDERKHPLDVLLL